MADRLTSSEKRDIRAAGKEVPLTPEPPTESDDDEDDQDEVESRAGSEKGKGKGKEVDAGEVACSSKKDDIAAPHQTAEPHQNDEHVEVTSADIFGGCESIGKL